MRASENLYAKRSINHTCRVPGIKVLDVLLNSIHSASATCFRELGPSM